MIRLLTGLLLATALLGGSLHRSFPKAYYAIKGPQQQKEAFVKILYPLIVKEEKKIAAQRRFVIALFKRLETDGIVTPSQIERLKKLAKTYRIKALYDKEAYLRRIDEIPVSLVLAQAAIESDWGKSRFARVANNLFGEWTWGGRGIVPKNRPAGKHYRIRIFGSLEDSIASYMKNLNRHWAYREFREARAAARKKGFSFGGFAAAAYLTHYSQRGELYTKMVKSKIAKNAWDIYDLEAAASAGTPGAMVMLSREILRR